MRKSLYTYTKPNVISVRISDDEMKRIEELMEKTNMKASEVLRKGFQLLTERFSEGGARKNPLGGLHPGLDGSESPC
jgi:hypothetical protein